MSNRWARPARVSPGRVCVVSPNVTGAPACSSSVLALAPATTAASVVPNLSAIASRVSVAVTVQGRVGSAKPTPAYSRPGTSAAAAATWAGVAPVAAAIEARVSGGWTT